MVYSTEMHDLYPSGLSLQSANVFFRHGARTPTSTYFVKETGISPYWPLCSAAKQFSSAILQQNGNGCQDTLHWSRSFETFREDNGPLQCEFSHKLCNRGELTDLGRAQMLSLGKQLRSLYVDDLKLLPHVLTDARTVSFRASPFERAQVSLQHVIWGFFPPEARAPSFGTPKIIVRSPEDETLLPNEDFCPRFTEICKEYTSRTGTRWDKSADMKYLNSLLRKYMPSYQPVKVKSEPSIHAIHDVINATAVTEKAETRLPQAFYDDKARDIVERIAYEEEYSAYHESREMRSIGIGSLMGDVVERMVIHAENVATDGEEAINSHPNRLFLAGTHDSTLAGIMASLGAVEEQSTKKWPRYGSTVAIELFRDVNSDGSSDVKRRVEKDTPILRTATSQLTEDQKECMNDYYVRLRYNNQSLTIPGCRQSGKNWKGNEQFCTLAAFKEIVDKFTPRDWKQACLSNMGKSSFPTTKEPAGY